MLFDLFFYIMIVLIYTCKAIGGFQILFWDKLAQSFWPLRHMQTQKSNSDPHDDEDADDVDDDSYDDIDNALCQLQFGVSKVFFFCKRLPSHWSRAGLNKAHPAVWLFVRPYWWYYGEVSLCL